MDFNNMKTFFAWTSNPQNLAMLALLIGSVGYCYEKFIGGRLRKRGESSDETKANTTLIEGLQKQLDGMDTLIKRKDDEHRATIETMRLEHKAAQEKSHAEINALTGKVGELTGQLREKDGKLAEYKEIFQGKDPKMDEVLSQLVEFMASMKPILEGISQHLKVEHPMMQ